MKKKSKIDIWGHISTILICAITILVGVFCIIDFALLTLFIFLGLATITGGYTLPNYFHTYYELGESELLITSGLKKKSIKYTDIKAIKESTCPIISFALSLERICVKDNDNREVYISPLDKDEFIAQLKIKMEECK